MRTISVEKLVGALLEELGSVTSGDEREAYEPAWLRGYVAGVANAASTAMELADDAEGGEA